MTVASITALAELLAENLPTIIAGRDLTPTQVDRLARLPDGMTARLIANDPTAYPCPRQWSRLTAALHVTAGELLAEPS